MSELGRRHYAQVSARHEVWALAPLFDGGIADLGGAADHISMNPRGFESPGTIVADAKDRLASVERWALHIARNAQEAQGIFAEGEDESRRADFARALGNFARSHIPQNIKAGRLTHFRLEAVAPREISHEHLLALREGEDLDAAVLIPDAEVVLRSTAERIGARVRSPSRIFGVVECLHAMQCVRSISSEGAILTAPRFVSVFLTQQFRINWLRDFFKRLVVELVYR